MIDESNKYDVCILGAGLAGTTLALQLINENPILRIAILEKRKERAPIAGHKVGESIVELSAHYLRKDLGLKNYLQENHLPKFGFRYFFDTPEKDKIENRIEVGSKTRKQAPSHHIDRGIFENDIIDIITNKGVHVHLDTSVTDVDLNLNSAEHIVHCESMDQNVKLSCNWFIDASGRRNFLKRKLNLNQTIEHNVSSAWFRIEKQIDPQTWSKDEKWKNELWPNFRRLSTNHLIGNGYWVWIIPLVNGNTSIGIVASESIHPISSYNNIEKFYEWLAQHEPQLASQIKGSEESIIDFKQIKNYAYGCKQFYSSGRWAITGEAGAFLDPFYSPGTDFIALSNSWITDLIKRDLKKENILPRVNMYEHTQQELLKGWFSLYRDMYSFLSGSRVLLTKIIWDWSTYWGILCPLYMNNGFIDINVMKIYASNEHQIGQRFNRLNENIQKIFLEWSAFDQQILDPRYINVFDIDYLYQMHLDLEKELQPDRLIETLISNLKILEGIGSEIFRKAYELKFGTKLEDYIDPYSASLKIKNSWQGNTKVAPITKIQEDFKILWDKQYQSNIDRRPLFEIRQESVEDIFVQSQKLAEGHGNIDELISVLNQFESDLRSVAYEGASFAIGMKALKSDNLQLWYDFLSKSDQIHMHHITIGFGWSFAALNIPFGYYNSIIEDNYLFPMILDGYGYYCALFKARRTLRNKEIPLEFDKCQLCAFDNGVGRRIWYTTKGNSDDIDTLISSFPIERQENLWSGVGMACMYVGGIDKSIVKELISKADKHHMDFIVGIVTSSIYNIISGRNIQETVDICWDLCNVTYKELSNINEEISSSNTKSTSDLMQIVRAHILKEEYHEN